MVTNRWIEENDLVWLDQALKRDEYHVGTKPEFYIQPGTVCTVLEDELGPVMCVRGAKSLRCDFAFMNNNDVVRNRAALLAGIDIITAQAKTAGFIELVGESNSDKLIAFFKNQKFEQMNDLRKLL